MKVVNSARMCAEGGDGPVQLTFHAPREIKKSQRTSQPNRLEEAGTAETQMADGRSGGAEDEWLCGRRAVQQSSESETWTHVLGKRRPTALHGGRHRRA